MLNARKRQASDTLLPTRQPKHPRVEDSTSVEPAAYSGYGRLVRVAVEFFSETVKTLGSRVYPPITFPNRPPRPRRSAAPPPPPRSRPHSIHTASSARATPFPRFQIPNVSHSHEHLPTEHNTQSSSVQSDQHSMQPCHNATNDIGTSLQSKSMTGLTFTSAFPSIVSPPHQTKDELLADSVQKCRRTEEVNSVISGRKSKEHIYARKHKARVTEERQKDREAMMKELFDLRRVADGYKSSFEDFKSWMNYQARLQHLDHRDILSPSASLTDLRLREDTPRLSSRHSFSDYADLPFLENAKKKLLRTLESTPTKPFSPYECLRQEARKKDEEIERRFRPSLPKSLPPEVDKQVDALLAKKGVISKIAREQVCDKDLSRLLPCQWLNDELINFYGAMILERSEAGKENPGANGRKKPLNVHYFNTFFWSKLQGEGYERARLAKWTKKIDLFSKDVILIPINHNNSHWTGAAINFRRKRIESYDSMNLDRHHVFKGLRHYLDLEHQNKKKKPFDFTGWVNYGPEDVPQQENGYDCGVFTCHFLEALSRGEETFNFSQRDMPYLRRRMAWEIGYIRFLDVS